MNDNKIYILILILFPYLYLFPLTFQFIEMGNDFELLYYSYKKYIYEFLLVGHFPLWSPSESLGYSLIFNPFAQYFYPLSWILYLISYLIGDISKHLYLLYTIFIRDIILYNNIVCSGIMIGIIHKIEKYGSLLLMFVVWRFFFSSLQC